MLLSTSLKRLENLSNFTLLKPPSLTGEILNQMSILSTSSSLEAVWPSMVSALTSVHFNCPKPKQLGLLIWT